jgi:hypothetical protein
MHHDRWLVAMSLMFLSGCSRSPAPPARPNVSPKGAASAAISLYDANHDGVLDMTEIMKSPALQTAAAHIDADKNGTITAAEIADYIRSWRLSNTILMAASPRFLFKGAPLVGATVTLDPAPFLGPNYPNATAVTDSTGKARFVGSDRKYPGVYVGLYQVRVSKMKDGKELIPARYNSATELALEITQSTWADAIFGGFALDAE